MNLIITLLLTYALNLTSINAMVEMIQGLNEMKKIIPSLKSNWYNIVEPVVDKLSFYNGEAALVRIQGLYSSRDEPITLFIIKDELNKYQCGYALPETVHYLYDLIKTIEPNNRFEYDIKTLKLSHWNVLLEDDDSGEAVTEMYENENNENKEMKLEIRYCDGDGSAYIVIISSTATIQQLKEALQQNVPELRNSEFMVGYRGKKLSNQQVLSDCISTDAVEGTPIVEICRNPVSSKPRQRIIARSNIRQTTNNQTL